MSTDIMKDIKEYCSTCKHEGNGKKNASNPCKKCTIKIHDDKISPTQWEEYLTKPLRETKEISFIEGDDIRTINEKMALRGITRSDVISLVPCEVRPPKFTDICSGGHRLYYWKDCE